MKESKRAVNLAERRGEMDSRGGGGLHVKALKKIICDKTVMKKTLELSSINF